MKTKRKTGKISTLGEKILDRQRALDAGKLAYNKADQLLEEIMQEVQLNQSVDLGDGQVAMLVDNFIDKKTGNPKNKVWKPTGVNRFDIVITRAADIAAKL